MDRRRRRHLRRHYQNHHFSRIYHQQLDQQLLRLQEPLLRAVRIRRVPR